MKSIKEKAREHSLEPRANAHFGYDEEDLENSFEAGANYVFDAMEEFMNNLKLGNSAAEKFYKLDLMEDIHDFIEQLKK